MSVNEVGLLLTAALVIAVRLGDAWAYRRRVRVRLLRLCATVELTCKASRIEATKSPPAEALTFTPAGQVR